MQYKTIYYFMVEDEIKKGEDVYCLDKQEKDVLHVNQLNYEYAIKLINDAKDNDRYEFWKETQKDAEEF